MIPEGSYTAKAIRAALSETKTQKEQVAVDFQILDGEAKGQRISWFNGLGSDKALEHAVKGLRNCGWKGSDLADLSGLDAEVELVVVHEEYNGKTSAKVRYVNALGGAARSALPADKAKSIAERMKAKIAEADKRIAAGKKSAAEPEEPPHPADSDMPF